MARLQANGDDYVLRIFPADSRIRLVEVIVGVEGINVDDANADVSIVMTNGVVHNRTFMTPNNASTLLRRWGETGESGGGAFLVVDDLVLVPQLTESGIEKAVLALLGEGELT